MDLKELRIGNFIQDTWVPENYDRFFIVQELEKNRCHYGMTSGVYHTRYENLRPIPITEEWLKKLGWQYYNGRTEGHMTMDTPCKLDIDWIGDKMQVKGHYEPAETYRPLNIQFVHQLQNLYFALTGTELVLKSEGEKSLN